MRTPEELIDEVRAQGGKNTPQRQVIFRLLHSSTSHPSADALFAQASEAMPGISRRTVYQTLGELVAMGDVRVVSAGGASRFDPNTTEHHHQICDRCGSITDVYLDDLGPLSSAAQHGFTVHAAHVMIRGLCVACSAPDLDGTSAARAVPTEAAPAGNAGTA